MGVSPVWEGTEGSKRGATWLATLAWRRGSTPHYLLSLSLSHSLSRTLHPLGELQNIRGSSCSSVIYMGGLCLLMEAWEGGKDDRKQSEQPFFLAPRLRAADRRRLGDLLSPPYDRLVSTLLRGEGAKQLLSVIWIILPRRV